MAEQISPDDLEREIILMEQELIFKRTLIEECREKLNSEISEHTKTKLTSNKYMNENKELQLQLDVCLAGTQKLEEEIKKSRELLVKFQVQIDVYLTERQQLLDACFQAEKENKLLKNEVTELKEQLNGHVMFVENFKLNKSKTEAILTEIMNKQETLNKEQDRLKAVCKEGLRFAEKLSEEAKFQMKFVKEAELGHEKMESRIIRLMAALSELKAENERIKTEKDQIGSVQPENANYLELWKSDQKEMRKRYEELQEINSRLLEELSLAKEQIEMLTKITETRTR